MNIRRLLRPTDPAAEARRNHPFVKRLRAIRKHHRASQLDVANCMHLADQAITKIEEGIQQLPGVVPGLGPSLHQWLEDWFRCVKPTAAERSELEHLLELEIFGRMLQRPQE